jgi:hypothetical protein
MRAWIFPALAALAGCIGPEDTPSTVHDLRVLGIKTDPPELMAPSCSFDPSDLDAYLALAAPIQVVSLVADPAGGGRQISYELWGCADPSDGACEDEENRVLLSQGTTQDGELALTVAPVLALLPDDTPFILRVVEEDPYTGLGGIRMPLVLHLQAGAEEIWAQKLMVYSCKYFPDQEQNVLPVLPGLMLGGAALDPGVPPDLLGPGPFTFAPMDFAALEEPYVVLGFPEPPSTTPAAIHLTESWMISWYADYGRFSPGTTGGANVIGVQGPNESEWRPPVPGEARDVRFWFVVRDGRGGLSWLTRQARYRP